MDYAKKTSFIFNFFCNHAVSNSFLLVSSALQNERLTLAWIFFFRVGNVSFEVDIGVLLRHYSWIFCLEISPIFSECQSWWFHKSLRFSKRGTTSTTIGSQKGIYHNIYLYTIYVSLCLFFFSSKYYIFVDSDFAKRFLGFGGHGQR